MSNTFKLNRLTLAALAAISVISAPAVAQNVVEQSAGVYQPAFVAKALTWSNYLKLHELVEDAKKDYPKYDDDAAAGTKGVKFLYTKEALEKLYGNSAGVTGALVNAEKWLDRSLAPSEDEAASEYFKDGNHTDGNLDKIINELEGAIAVVKESKEASPAAEFEKYFLDSSNGGLVKTYFQTEDNLAKDKKETAIKHCEEQVKVTLLSGEQKSWSKESCEKMWNKLVDIKAISDEGNYHKWETFRDAYVSFNKLKDELETTTKEDAAKPSGDKTTQLKDEFVKIYATFPYYKGQCELFYSKASCDAFLAGRTPIVGYNARVLDKVNPPTEAELQQFVNEAKKVQGLLKDPTELGEARDKFMEQYKELQKVKAKIPSGKKCDDIYYASGCGEEPPSATLYYGLTEVSTPPPSDLNSAILGDEIEAAYELLVNFQTSNKEDSIFTGQSIEDLLTTTKLGSYTESIIKVVSRMREKSKDQEPAVKYTPPSKSYTNDEGADALAWEKHRSVQRAHLAQKLLDAKDALDACKKDASKCLPGLQESYNAAVAYMGGQTYGTKDEVARDTWGYADKLRDILLSKTGDPNAAAGEVSAALDEAYKNLARVLNQLKDLIGSGDEVTTATCVSNLSILAFEPAALQARCEKLVTAYDQAKAMIPASYLSKARVLVAKAAGTVSTDTDKINETTTILENAMQDLLDAFPAKEKDKTEANNALGTANGVAIKCEQVTGVAECKKLTDAIAALNAALNKSGVTVGELRKAKEAVVAAEKAAATALAAGGTHNPGTQQDPGTQQGGNAGTTSSDVPFPILGWFGLAGLMSLLGLGASRRRRS